MRAISLSNDGKYLAGCGYDKIGVWELESGKLVSLVTILGTWVNSISISPDEKYVITGDNNKVVKVWELATRSLVKTLGLHD